MLKRLLMALVATFTLLGAANAQDDSSQAQIRAAASYQLLQMDEIILTGTTVQGVPFQMRLYPKEGYFTVLYREKGNACFNSRMPARFVVNQLGLLSMYSNALFGMTFNCLGIRVNIDPILGIAGEYNWNPSTGEQSRDSGRLYLQR